jgi:hypothetical protein
MTTIVGLFDFLSSALKLMYFYMSIDWRAGGMVWGLAFALLIISWLCEKFGNVV